MKEILDFYKEYPLAVLKDYLEFKGEPSNTLENECFIHIDGDNSYSLYLIKKVDCYDIEVEEFTIIELEGEPVFVVYSVNYPGKDHFLNLNVIPFPKELFSEIYQIYQGSHKGILNLIESELDGRDF